MIQNLSYQGKDRTYQLAITKILNAEMAGFGHNMIIHELIEVPLNYDPAYLFIKSK